MMHTYKRLRELGFSNSIHILRNKLSRKLFRLQCKDRALKNMAGHSWSAIANIHYVKTSFPIFFAHCSQKKLQSSQLEMMPQDKLLSQADAYTGNSFNILGSGPQTFTRMPWHEDFRLKTINPQADNTFDRRSFYQDIRIGNNNGSDIKVPWELSRFQHLLILGQAYEITHDARYAHTFTEQITDWLDNNPYLLGINWLCPMEVGIHAINWVWAWHYFTHSSDVLPAFWQRFTCSLYDHLHYLENNWEIFDTKTSNHYLSDLLGYLYLCWFFKDLPGIHKKRDWCIKELVKEFDKQVFNEGTDYESSTAYHCLVTEIFDHFKMLCLEMHITLPNTFHEKLSRMHEFISLCRINEREMVKIGDDDSGRVLLANLIKPSLNIKKAEAFFPNFGLSIIKTNTWHITLRHLAYKKEQPSAHFHNDALSITLAIDGIPIIIDPGSYLYTASTSWRNYFRSAFVHNGFYVEDIEPAPFDERLFALNLPETNLRIPALSSSHALYARLGLEAERSLTFDEHILTLTDLWKGSATGFIPTGWNFTLHPEIKAHLEGTRWILSHNNKRLCAIIADLKFGLHEAWVAPEYGIKVPSLCLRASQLVVPGEPTTIQIIKL